MSDIKKIALTMRAKNHTAKFGTDRSLSRADYYEQHSKWRRHHSVLKKIDVNSFDGKHNIGRMTIDMIQNASQVVYYTIFDYHFANVVRGWQTKPCISCKFFTAKERIRMNLNLSYGGRDGAE